MKQLFSVLVVFLLTVYICQAQSNFPKPVADSLWAVWSDSKQADTSRLHSIHKFVLQGYLKTKPDSAIYYAQMQYDFAETKGLKKQMSDALNTQGIASINRGNYEDALGYYSRSLKLREEIDYKEGMVQSLNSIGVIYSSRGDHSNGLSYFARCLKINEEIGDLKGIAQNLNNMGNINRDKGNYKKAIEEFSRSLKIREEIGDKRGIASTLNNFGYVYLLQGDYEIGLDYFLRSLKFANEIGDKKTISAALFSLGQTYLSQGEYTRAFDYYSQNLKVKEEINDLLGVSASLNSIGIVYKEKGDYTKALNFYTRSLLLHQKLGNKTGIAKTSMNISFIYFAHGNNKLAFEYLSKSLNIMMELEDKHGIGNALNNIGNIYKEQNVIDSALEYYSRSLVVREEINDKQGISMSLNNIGNIHNRRGDLKVALDFYSRSLKIKEEISDKSGKTQALNNIGNIYYFKKELANAISYCRRAFELSVEIGDDEGIKNSSKSLYGIYIKCDSLLLAKEYLSILIQRRNTNLQTNFFSLPENEKQTYFETMEKDYGQYHDFTLKFQNEFEDCTDTSYNLILQNKGITLKSSTAMRQAIQNSSDTSLIKSYESWLSLKKKFAKTNESDSTYKEIENRINAMERELIKSSDIFSEYDKARKLKWQDVQEGLKEHEAAIEFIHFRSEIDTTQPVIYAALIVDKNSKHPEMIKLCTETELENILGNRQGNNQEYINKVYGDKLHKETGLYEKIWKPMEKRLSGIKNVYFSPTGLLHKVAFHSIAKDQNLFLCDQYNLNQQSSTGKVALPDKMDFNANSNYLMLGGVQYDSDTTINKIWPYLQGTLSETDQIKSLLDKQKKVVNYFTASATTEETFKSNAPSANIIHIATHGFFFSDPKQVQNELATQTITNKKIMFRGSDLLKDSLQQNTQYAEWTFIKNQNPLMRSGLVLAYANDVWQRPSLLEGEDGVLTAQEVSTLDLRNTSLVVLSACETGLGEIKGSEGVFGLQRAFKMAGVKNIIMSLWQVPDEETSEFMHLFYKNLIKLKETKKAFSATQKEMRKKYDPFFWAAFVLVE